MKKKTIGIIMMAVAGVIATVALGLLVKWHPIHIGVVAVAVAIGYVGNMLYRKG